MKNKGIFSSCLLDSHIEDSRDNMMEIDNTTENWRKIHEALELITQLSQLFGAYNKREMPELLLKKLGVAIANLEDITEFLQTKKNQNLNKNK